MNESKKKYLSPENLSILLSSNQGIIFLVLAGILFLGLGVLFYKTGGFKTSSKVEIINPSNSPDFSKEIVVEIAGSVENPGVYKMKNGDRIEDLLVIAGGLSVNADRVWVEKSVNRAAKIYDGQKIYIYHLGEVSAKTNGDIKLYQGVLGTENDGLIDINTASFEELDRLPGIGQKYGQSIIEHRPYSTLEDLVKNGAIKQPVFEKIKDLIKV